MDYQLQREIASWDSEVEAEMGRLIRAGTPRLFAAQRAPMNVSERRRKESSSKRGEAFRKVRGTPVPREQEG